MEAAGVAGADSVSGGGYMHVAGGDAAPIGFWLSGTWVHVCLMGPSCVCHSGTPKHGAACIASHACREQRIGVMESGCSVLAGDKALHNRCTQEW